MTATSGAKPALAEFATGGKSPVYFDRQVIRASDLTLDRESHDRELERLRRYLHGWGIVVGFEVYATADTIRISEGYGVTPGGQEAYLPFPVNISNISAQITNCCGPDTLDCSTISEEDILRITAAIEETTINAWLIARPVSTPSDLRSGIPADCDHPASVLLPSRACDGLRLELICELPEPHLPVLRSCDAMKPYLCGPARHLPPPYLAMPRAYGPEVEFLVLAKLIRTKTESGFRITVDRTDRKTLLPNWILQQYLSSCVCNLTAAPPTEPPVEAPTDDTEESEDEAPMTPGEEVDWDIIDRVDEPELIHEDELNFPPNDGVTDPPRHFERFERLKDREIQIKLEAAGVNNPLEFINADPEILAETTGISLAEIAETQLALGEVAHRFNELRF